MPKIVDHEARRSDISRAVLRVVARSGVRGADLRSVAEEASWSTGVIHHYFGDKQALLAAALTEAVKIVGERMDSIQEHESGDDRVLALLEAGMPLDEERSATCRIFFHFSAEGFHDPAMAMELAGYYAWWRTEVRRAIEGAQQEGRFAGAAAEPLSERLVALAEGLGIQGMFDPKAMNPRKLRRHVAEMVGQFGSASEFTRIGRREDV